MKTNTYFIAIIVLGSISAVSFFSCESHIPDENAAYERFKEHQLSVNETIDTTDTIAVAVTPPMAIKNRKQEKWHKFKFIKRKKNHKKNMDISYSKKR